MYRNRSIAVVVPSYNEELLIWPTLQSMPTYIDKIYVIDDCSTDRTHEVLEKAASRDPRIVCIKHEENRGVGAAIITGYKKALTDKMDITAVMAGDNQMDPAFLSGFLDPIVDGEADYSKGNRLISSVYTKGMSKWRLLGNSILTFLTKIASGYWNVIDPQNGYTAISKNALEKIDLDSIYPRYGYCNDMLVKLNIDGFNIANVPHPARYGTEKSKIKYGNYILKLSCLLLSMFFWRIKIKYIFANFHPLVLFYSFGPILTILGLMGASYSVYYKVFLHGAIYEKGILSMIVFIIGLQFIFFAMVLDMQSEAKERTNSERDLNRILAAMKEKNAIEPNQANYIYIDKNTKQSDKIQISNDPFIHD